jgi:hypothetical protein
MGPTPNTPPLRGLGVGAVDGKGSSPEPKPRTARCATATMSVGSPKSDRVRHRAKQKGRCPPRQTGVGSVGYGWQDPGEIAQDTHVYKHGLPDGAPFGAQQAAPQCRAGRSPAPDPRPHDDTITMHNTGGRRQPSDCHSNPSMAERLTKAPLQCPLAISAGRLKFGTEHELRLR